MVAYRKGRKMKHGFSRRENPREYDRLDVIYRMKKNPLNRILSVAKYRAKQLGYKFSITKDDLTLPTHCPILGIKLRYNPGKRKDNSYSIDRIDPSKGYIPGNVAIISWKANRTKRDVSVDFCKRIIKYARKFGVR